MFIILIEDLVSVTRVELNGDVFYACCLITFGRSLYSLTVLTYGIILTRYEKERKVFGNRIDVHVFLHSLYKFKQCQIAVCRKIKTAIGVRDIVIHILFVFAEPVKRGSGILYLLKISPEAHLGNKGGHAFWALKQRGKLGKSSPRTYRSRIRMSRSHDHRHTDSGSVAVNIISGYKRAHAVAENNHRKSGEFLLGYFLEPVHIPYDNRSGILLAKIPLGLSLGDTSAVSEMIFSGYDKTV